MLYAKVAISPLKTRLCVISLKICVGYWRNDILDYDNLPVKFYLDS